MSGSWHTPEQILRDNAKAQRTAAEQYRRDVAWLLERAAEADEQALLFEEAADKLSAKE